MKYVLFDLDSTLYTDDTGLFQALGVRLEAWVAQALGISLEASKALRREYFLAYGTMMRGLILHHPEVDVDAFLEYVHGVDVGRYLAPDPALAAMLARLDVRKVVFTNSIAGWAERILERLGVRQYFERIIDVRAVDYQSKPHPHAFARALEILGVAGPECVMVDDQPHYLAGASAAGMRTVLVREGAAATDGIDFAVDHILEVEPVLQALIAQRAA